MVKPSDDLGKVKRQGQPRFSDCEMGLEAYAPLLKGVENIF